jgi:hypothetical protein
MVQFLRPAATVNNNGGWTTNAGTLHGALNSSTINDATFITSPGTAAGGRVTCAGVPVRPGRWGHVPGQLGNVPGCP